MRVDRVLGETTIVEVYCTGCPENSDLGTNTMKPGEDDYNKRQRRIAREHVVKTGHRVALFTERAEYLGPVDRA